MDKKGEKRVIVYEIFIIVFFLFKVFVCLKIEFEISDVGIKVF